MISYREYLENYEHVINGYLFKEISDSGKVEWVANLPDLFVYIRKIKELPSPSNVAHLDSTYGHFIFEIYFNESGKKGKNLNPATQANINYDTALDAMKASVNFVLTDAYSPTETNISDWIRMPSNQDYFISIGAHDYIAPIE